MAKTPPVPDLLPQSGGSYVRDPISGALTPNDPQPAVVSADDPPANAGGEVAAGVDPVSKE